MRRMPETSILKSTTGKNIRVFGKQAQHFEIKVIVVDNVDESILETNIMSNYNFVVVVDVRI